LGSRVRSTKPLRLRHDHHGDQNEVAQPLATPVRAGHAWAAPKGTGIGPRAA
jgi:hypothetical protein